MKQVSLLVISVLAATAAVAQVPEFEDADVNEDGALSIIEFQAAAPTLAVTDTNGDGMLNQSEIQAAAPDLDFAGAGFQGGAALVGESEYDYIMEVLLDAES